MRATSEHQANPDVSVPSWLTLLAGLFNNLMQPVGITYERQLPVLAARERQRKSRSNLATVSRWMIAVTSMS